MPEAQAKAQARTSRRKRRSQGCHNVRVHSPATTLLHHIATKGEERQLLLNIRAEGDDFGPIYMQVLIDTGAEANLVRTGLVSPGALKKSKQPLILVTASGSRMEGGQLDVNMTLTFGAKSLEGETLPEWSTQGTFHGADIQVDAILS